MARYRKLDPRIWGDEKFLKLGEGEKLLVLYLLQSRQTNRIGCYQFSPGMASDELGCSIQTMGNRFDTVMETLSWRFSEAVRLLYIPTWFDYQPPSNPNQVQGWSTDFHELPDDPLKWQCYQSLRATCQDLGKGFVERFHQAFGNHSLNGYPNQEQEQEQYQEQENPPKAPPRGGREKVVRGELEWRAEEVWKAHLKQRAGFFENETGRVPPEPQLTAHLLKQIKESLKRHDGDLLKPEQRGEWEERSLTRAAGVGIFLDKFMTGRSRDNDVTNGGRRYLEPERCWKIPRGKPDPVPRFADRYFETKGAQQS